MEDFELEYEDTRMPYMKASIDIPLKLLDENIEQVNTDLKEFSENITEGKLIISVSVGDDGNCCFQVNKLVEKEDDVTEYDLNITTIENGVKVVIFKLEETMIVHTKYNGLEYIVNIKE